MAASIVIEEEHGTSTRSRHPHNGYYAGDFRTGRAASAWQGSSHGSLTAYALRAAITSAVR